MLALKWSAGVAPEVKLRNPLHTGKEACKQGIHTAFETQGRCHQKSKTWVLVAPQKGLMSSEFFFPIFFRRNDRVSVGLAVTDNNSSGKILGTHHTFIFV